jgi:hypothetical protein
LALVPQSIARPVENQPAVMEGPLPEEGLQAALGDQAQRRDQALGRGVVDAQAQRDVGAGSARDR